MELKNLKKKVSYRSFKSIKKRVSDYVGDYR